MRLVAFPRVIAAACALVTAVLLGPAAMAQEQPPEPELAHAVLRDVTGAEVGVATFIQIEGTPLLAVGAVERGIAPVSAFHGFHVHETGMCDPDAPDGPFTSAGGHYVGDGGAHGEHDGDLPPLFVTSEGRGVTSAATDRLTLDEVVGRAVMIHELPDNLANVPDERYDSADGGPVPDEVTLAGGDSGTRLACGVIEEGGPETRPGGTNGPPMEPIDVTILAAELTNDEGASAGAATFTFIEETTTVAVGAQARGLDPAGEFHGFHVHAGDRCRSDADTYDFRYARGHLGHNPPESEHGHHPGDLPALLASETGTALGASVTDQLDEATVQGRAVIVHADRDNYGNIPDRYVTATGAEGPDADTLATGDAGQRQLCGEVEGAVRLAGANRIATAVAISENSFLEGEAEAVVLARADRFPDALAGVPLAVRRNAPVLLTPPDTLDLATQGEISRALGDSGTVYIMGGEQAITSAVQDKVQGLGYDIVRLGGETRVDTAVSVLRELGDVQRIFVTTGAKFPDALTAGAAAGARDGAVLFSLGDTPQPQTTQAIEERGVETFAVGGPAARAYPSAQPVVGSNRNQTAVAVATRFFPEPHYVGLAVQGDVGTDDDMTFADALTGSAHVARLGGPLLLTGTDDLDPDTAAYATANAEHIVRTYAYGGPAALSDAVVAGFATAAREPVIPMR